CLEVARKCGLKSWEWCGGGGVEWRIGKRGLITADIQEASYCQEYLAKVAKHQRYLAGETGSDPDSPASKPPKIARKPKPTVPKAYPRPSVSKPISSTQAEPKSAPAKTQGKKRKLTTEISDKPSKAIKSRHGFSTPKSVDKSVAEDVPAKEPRVNEEEADVQRALEESMKNMYDVTRGPLPLVVIREPESGKYQLLPEVPGKGKAKLGLTDSEEETKEVVHGADAGGQGEGHARPDPGAQDEGHDGSKPDEQAESKGQAGPDRGNAEESQPMPSHVVHAGSDPYPKAQENLKLTVQEQVLLEEPASSSGTLSSLQHLTKDLSFGDLFFNDKPSEADNDKATAETEAKKWCRPESPKVHQQLKATAIETTTTTTTTSLPPPYQQQQSIRLDSHGARLYTLEQLDIPRQNRFRDLPSADMKEILHQRMWETDSYKSHEDHMQLYEALEKSMNHDNSEELAKDLAKVRKKKKSRESLKTPPGSPPHQPPPPPLPAGSSRASGSPAAFGSSQVPPPPPLPPSTNQESQSKGSAAPSSPKTAVSAEYQAWTTTDIRLRPSISLTPADLQMNEDMAPDEQA
nr:hypothetical protein [Tanacetum cinerariifolium]